MTPLRLRSTLRRMMISVGAVAILLAGGIEGARMSRRAREFRQRATEFTSLEAVCRDAARIHEEKRTLYQGRPETLASNERSVHHNLRLAAHFSVLRQKYSNAAVRPWVDVAPDPPGPSFP